MNIEILKNEQFLRAQNDMSAQFALRNDSSVKLYLDATLHRYAHPAVAAR